jgi:hypothetical protein
LFSGIHLTTAGAALLAKIHQGKSTLTLTGAACGSGSLPTGGTEKERTALVTKVKDLPIANISRAKSIATIEIRFSNSGMTDAFDFKELGIYATDPDNGTILYAYANAGTSADKIPSGTTSPLEYILAVQLQISEDTSVELKISDSILYVTKDDIDKYLTTINNKADKATTISGYNITDAYTKDEVNNMLNQISGKISGVYAGTSAPSNLKALWIDTGNGGIAKYYDEAAKAWATVKAVWG